jgi:MFS transporter, DHA1 family, multidrug resistance protein
VKLSWRGTNLLFLVCSALQSAADGHLTAFTPLLLRELGLAPSEIATWTGMFVAITMTMAMPLAPFWGVLAERFSRRPIILRTYLLEAAALLIAARAGDVRWLIVARMLIGLCNGSGGVMIATQAMITPSQRLGSAIATVQASQPIAASLGPPIGALLIPRIGLRGLFEADAVVMLLAALAIGLLMPEPANRVQRGSVLSRAGEVLRLVWKTPPIRWNFVCAFLMRGGTSVADAYLPVRITQLAADPATAIGWILGIYGLLTTLATWLVGRVIDRTEAAVLYSRAMLLGTILTAGLALAPSLQWLGVLAALRSIPMACSNTVLYTHAARVLPIAEQTAVFSLSPFPRNASQIFFPMLAALIAGLAPGAALGVSAAVAGATFLASLRLRAVTPGTASRLVEGRESAVQPSDSVSS